MQKIENQIEQHSKQSRSEKEEIELAKENPVQFKVLYDRYYNQIYRFLINRIGDKEATADVVSEVFLKALLNIKKYKYKGFPFSSWLFRIAINESNRFFNSNKRIRYVSLTENLYNKLGDEFLLFEEDKKDRLNELLKTLSKKELQLIELRFFESMSFKMLGDVLGITENNAKVRMYRLLEKMNKKLKAHEK